MGLLQQARDRLVALGEAHGVDPDARIAVRALAPDEAIGARASHEFVIKKGKERVIEATFRDARGQAFTDQPSEWTGTVREMLALDLSDVARRAVFVAGMNAVLRAIQLAEGTVHCRNEDPSRCGPELTGRLEARFGHKRFGLIGLQPAILGSLVDRFGPQAVRVVDLNPESVGQSKSGVTVWNGQTDLARLVDWCEVGLATGSSIVNGTIDEIVPQFDDADKPLLLFGNTISGAAALLGLQRVCPFGR